MALSTINWLTLLVFVGGAVHQSFPQQSSTFKFSLTSDSNQSGLRILTVGLENEAKSRGQVILNANHWSGMCECAETAGVQGAPVTVPRPSPPRKPVTDCRPNYVLLPGVGCYKEVKDAMPWREAQSSCVAEGAQLAIPESQEQMDFFIQIVAHDGYNHWLGIHKGEKWMSVHGSAFPLYSGYWASGYPREGNGDCAFVAAKGLYNYRCSAVRRFICQQQ